MFIIYTDKFDSLWQTTCALLHSAEEELLTTTRETLLLSMAHWSLNLGNLECLASLLNDMTAANSTCEMESRLKNLKAVIPVLLLSVIRYEFSLRVRISFQSLFSLF